MDETKKIHRIGGTVAPTKLSAASLVKFAEAIIRSDKEAALRSQQGVQDLVTPSQDSREEVRNVRMSSLESLCGKTGTVKIQRPAGEAPDEPDNIVSFGSRKKS